MCVCMYVLLFAHCFFYGYSYTVKIPLVFRLVIELCARAIEEKATAYEGLKAPYWELLWMYYILDMQESGDITEQTDWRAK